MPEVWSRITGGKALAVSELEDAASELWTNCQHIKVWLFSGEMGAGKTTLITALGKHLRVKQVMSSPTFSIVNEYSTQSGLKIYHFDFYRIKNEREAFDIGVDEYLESGNYCWIEWPAKIPSLIPPANVEIAINPVGPEHRTIAYVKHDREEKNGIRSTGQDEPLSPGGDVEGKERETLFFYRIAARDFSSGKSDKPYT